MLGPVPLPLGSPTALRFSGAAGCHVDHGYFWGHAANTDLGTGFWWESWVAPRGSGYLVSDGYGGAHALLWGVTGSTSFTATGNVWNGTAAVDFNGLYGAGVGEWVHLVVWWDGLALRTFANGVGDGWKAWTGPRRTVGPGTGAGKLYVGGSDHLNLACDLAAIRAWDRSNVLSTSGLLNTAFRPQRTYQGDAYDNGGAAYRTPPDFLADYTVPSGGLVNDHAPEGGVVSYTGGAKRRHPGRLTCVGQNAVLAQTAPLGSVAEVGAYPRWVSSPSCPYAQPIGSGASGEPARTPAAVPGGALAFDSFGRANQTLAFQAVPALGSTEGGSLGPLAWQSSSPGQFGILGGMGCFLGTLGNKTAWVPVGVADQDVRVTNQRGAGTTGGTGICFRVLDADNFWYAYGYGDPTANVIFYGRYVAGVLTDLGNTNPGTAWNTLRVLAQGTAIRIYTDATERVSLTGQTVLQSATGAGICGAHQGYFTSSFDRYRNFTVFAG